MNRDHKKCKRLLINGVYSRAIGHVVECLVAANAYRNRNPDAEIGVLVNAGVPEEMLLFASHINIVSFLVSVEDFNVPAPSRSIFKIIGREWDFVLHLRDARDVSWNPGLARFHIELREWMHGTSCSELLSHRDPNAPPCRLKSFRFQLPAELITKYQDFFTTADSPRIMILTAAARFQKKPSFDFWRLVIDGILARFPNATFIIAGSSNSAYNSTQSTSAVEIEQLIRSCPRVRSVFNVGFAGQLAIAKACHLLISPHSGFAFAVQCLNVPWLVLSGWSYPEYLFNGVPIVCIYPTCDRYPCGSKDGRSTILSECTAIIRQGKSPLPCLSDSSLVPQIPNIVEKVELLLSNRPYREFVREHRRQLARKGCREIIFACSP